MGEIADMMLDGILDANGEYTGKNPGHPVYPKGWFGNTGMDYKKKCLNFLKERKVKQPDAIISQYGVRIGCLSLKQNKICKAICQEDKNWKKFKSWVDDKIGYVKPSKINGKGA